MADDRTPEDLGGWPTLLNTGGAYEVASEAWLWARVDSLSLRTSLYVSALAHLFGHADVFLALAVGGVKVRLPWPVIRPLARGEAFRAPYR